MPTRLLSAVLLVVIALAGVVSSPVQAQAPLVCVDAGHGGSDTGTGNRGIIEKDLNLAVALRFGALLEANGYGTAYTRQGDSGLSNTERAQICNAAAATILVSVHHNGSSDSSTDYTTALYQKRIDRDLASIISAHVAPATSDVNWGIMQFASSVLIKSDMPATMSEGYFLTNNVERDRLNDFAENPTNPWTPCAYCDTEAGALFNGVVAYLGSNGGGDTGQAPLAPAWMTATLNSVRGPNATIDLAWEDTTGETGYRIYRSTNGNAYELILDNLAANTTSAQDRVKTGQTYQYCVAAFNEFGASEWACSGAVTTTR